MPELFAVVGATGTGKSALAIELAETLGARGEAAEIVNADAMQLYRGMDIGTAKLSLAERRGVAHHQLDVLEPSQEASVAAYQQAARDDINQIWQRGAHAILVGGSGLYCSAVLFQFDFPGTDQAIRHELETELEQHGPGALYRQLQNADVKTAEQIGPHNGRRLVRALEVIAITGSASAARLPEHPVPWQPARIVRLEEERAELVRRLDERVEAMWAAGLLDEVSVLLEHGLAEGPTASKAIGYAQAIAELRGDIDRAAAIEQAKVLTRNYARKQVNWFSRYRQALVARTGQTGTVQRLLADI